MTASGDVPPQFAPVPRSPSPERVDQAGLNDAFVSHSPELTRMARRVLGSPHLAEEAVQETFVRAWRSRDGFDPALGTLRAWLFAIERNLLIDMSRARVRREELEARQDRQPEATADDVEGALVSWQVEEAIGRLTPEHRAVLVEIYFRGHTSKEMAEALAVPEGTVRSRLFYALRSLRAILEEMGWEE